MSAPTASATVLPADGFGPWVNRPASRIAPEIQPFWNGLVRHELLLCRCSECGAWYFPYTLCVHGSSNGATEWVPASGRGTIFTYCVVERVVDADYADEVPYGLAMVELEEGPLLPARIATSDPYSVGVGSAVTIAYLDVAATGRTLPFFCPASDESGAGE